MILKVKPHESTKQKKLIELSTLIESIKVRRLAKAVEKTRSKLLEQYFYMETILITG